LLNENELRDLSEHYSIIYDDLKSEEWLYKSKIDDQKMNLSQGTKFIMKNNFHIGFSCLNKLLKRYQSIRANLNHYRSGPETVRISHRSSPIYLLI
jgi:hypothetical protein